MTLSCGRVSGWSVLVLVLAGSVAAQEEPAAPDPMLADAQLADVVFVDRHHGWAVGDRGVIWHTADAGRTWVLQPSGVDCRLSSVCFLSDKVGWAAGGYIQPYTHATVGVLLRTRDGGEHWQPARARVLPAIRRIGFFDAQQGWALGQTSAYFPTGVYTTGDGGKSWAAVPGSAGRAWLAGDFIDANTGALAGRASSIATVRRRGVDGQQADFGLRALTRMKLNAPSSGWLVGDGGLVLATRDLGKSWQTPEGSLPRGAANQFNFGALAVSGEHVWVAGTPGTRVLHSADGGQSWQAADTGQALPIRSLAFADEQHGWAVGDLGTILATVDGGQTWKPQRAGGRRAAIAGFFSRPEEMPLELLALVSADEGYLGAI
ncbi:MAG TPA: YCF48-related protein, partial [Pirellulales bacterium]|nr:YCF48-related protein [Pirellulales bacterium]